MKAFILGGLVSLGLAMNLQAGDSALDAELGGETYWEDLTDGTIDLYENEDSPWIQRVQLMGRFQYQAAAVDGSDVRGTDFWETYSDFRRVRLETEIDFLRYFTTKVGVNLVDDRRFRGERNTGFGYDDFVNAWVAVDLEDLFDLKVVDDLDLQFGRQKVKVGYEHRQSSNDIYTVERSALSDRISGQEGRPTGFMLSAEKGDFALDLGYFSVSPDEILASFDGDGFYYASLGYQPNKKWDFRADLVLSDSEGRVGEGTGYGWVSALSGSYETKRKGVAVTLAYGDNGGAESGNVRARRQGNFYGAMVMPWYWVKKEKLQIVGQVQWQGSEEAEGIRIASRYLRQIDDQRGYEIENGRGDEHFSAYFGVNYHPWKNNTKIMTGVAYDELSTRSGQVSGVSYFLAFRSEF